jgi:hypothetical protein
VIRNLLNTASPARRAYPPRAKNIHINFVLIYYFNGNGLEQHYLRVSMVFARMGGQNHEQILQRTSSLELASGDSKHLY